MAHEAPAVSVFRSAVRVTSVVLLSAFVLGSTIPNLWVNIVHLPVDVDVHLQVTGVYGVAVPAGVRVGDVIDWAGCSLPARLALDGDYLLPPGSALPLPVIRDGRKLTPVIRVPTDVATPILLTLIKRTAATAFVVVAAILLLRRPSTMLWGFFLYALGSVSGDPLAYLRFGMGWFAIHVWSLALFANVGGPVGLLLFGTRFPNDHVDGWRRRVDRLIVPAAVVFAILVGMRIAADITLQQPTWALTTAAYIVATTIGLLCFLDSYVHTGAEGRQRLKWVALGLGIYYIAEAYVYIAGYLPGGGWPTAWAEADWTVDILAGFQIFIPITVAYAVLKHKVLDVNFVFSRALVYGVLTSVSVAVLALVDWFFTKELEQRQAAVTAEVVAALGLGFSMNALHNFVDGIIDRVIFRRRHLAQTRLARAAAGVHHVTDPDAIDETLAMEPLDAIGLSSAAVFRRGDDGRFVRTLATGWDGGTADALSANDPIVQGLQGERGVIRLRDVRAPHGALPAGAPAPAIAVPLFVRHELDGFVLYGSHVGGEDFDAEEIALLDRLAGAAASTYDHLEADAARREVERLARELGEARRTIATLRPMA